MADLPQQVNGIAVDLASFDGLIKRLQIISDYVHYDLTGLFNREVAPHGQNVNLLGGLPEGQGIMARAGTNIAQIQQELAALQGRLQQLVAQTGTLHDTYKSLEEKNRADIAKVEELLLAAPAGPGLPGNPTSPAYPTSPV